MFGGKIVSEITETDLKDLIQNKVKERQTLEYKEKMYGRTDKEVKEMLRDITSIANAYGGYLIIGIRTNKEEIPIEIPGIDNGEQEAMRIMSSCLSNVEVRIIGLNVWPVPLTNGRHAIVVHIPRSLRAPHMITFKGINQFWIRHDTQKSKMSIHEVREACLKVEALRTNIQDFIQQRKTVARQCDWGSSYFISVTPIIVRDEIVDIFDERIRNLLKDPPDQRPEGWNVKCDGRVRPTLYGLQTEIKNRKRLEVFRNGHIEFQVAITKDPFCKRTIKVENTEYLVLHPWCLVEYPVSLLRFGRSFYLAVGLQEPVIVSICLFGITGYALYQKVDDRYSIPGTAYGPSLWNASRGNDLEIPPMQVPSLENPDKVAQIFADRIWNAFRFDHAPLFDPEGNFKP